MPSANEIIADRMIVRGEEQIYALTGLHRTRRNELIARGEFPKPIKLSDRAVGFRLSDIIIWQNSKIAVTADKA